MFTHSKPIWIILRDRHMTIDYVSTKTDAFHENKFYSFDLTKINEKVDFILASHPF